MRLPRGLRGKIQPHKLNHSFFRDKSVFRKIGIQNFKSIKSLDLELGRINVFIGENGAGKSNILEAIALAGAANADKLDSEFLMSRGIRLTSAPLMRSQFSDDNDNSLIEIEIGDDESNDTTFICRNENTPYSNWMTTKIRSAKKPIDHYRNQMKTLAESDPTVFAELRKSIEEIVKKIDSNEIESVDRNGNVRVSLSPENLIRSFLENSVDEYDSSLIKLNDFVIYSPENSALRALDREGQIEPLGINGEGLVKLLLVLSEVDDGKTIKSINESLKLLGWFEGFDVSQVHGSTSAVLDIRDKYLTLGRNKLDHRSANEGFMFLLFYFALFSTKLTPCFFAIDNIDASLNPKLCSNLMEELSKLAILNDKQALFTTHNPAVLDGLNLDDPEQRLFVVRRTPNGDTRVKRITKPSGINLKLSEMFLRGVIGGLPKGF